MNFHRNLQKILPIICAIALMFAHSASRADDIDLFTGTSAGSSDFPNVLIILDNSSNWSAANQNWPTDTAPPVPCGNDCNKQGYYELKAIRSVVNALPVDASGNVSLNVGLMMFNNSNANRDGAYVRYHVRQLSAANKADFTAKLDQIITGFNTETAASSVQYEAALWDAFKYFGGFTNPDNANKDLAPPSNPPFNGIEVFGTKFWGSNDADGAKPDGAAYSGVNFVPVSTTSCGKNFIIFIGNGFPAQSTANGGVNDMEHVLELLTNPSSPPASITQFPLSTYTYSCNSTWSNASGYSCGTSAACTTSLAGLTNSAAKMYRCDKSDCNGASRRIQQCTDVTTTVTQQMPAGNAQGRFADEFTNFLYKTDVSDLASQQNVVTYTVNVYKDQPSDDQTALMYNMATKAGGKAFNATNEQALINALQEIFIEIQSVNSTFASASLPINATNRSFNENQVFIGMFRPDSAASPRWFGNVKRYQLIFDQAGNLELGDVNGLGAINNTTGFINDCATSWWTTDSPNPPGKADNSGYWSAYDIQPSPAGKCLSSAYNQFSDAPDGPRVEKGAVAEAIRKGNNPEVTNATPTWVENRTIYTASGTALNEFNATNVSLTSYDNGSISSNDRRVLWARGQDTEDENGNGDLGSQSPAFANMVKETRASLHGDVVHSRPLPVTYSNQTIIFYGANDGGLHAANVSNGQELWAFIAPEFNARLDRLRTQSPKVCYPNMLGMTYDTNGACTAGSPAPTKRDFFFDGSIGLYQPAGDTAWIFPTMRRGGRMIYALDVSNGATTPSIKWKFGCPNPDNDTGCSTNATNIGQTWSMPNAAFIKGYSTTQPVLTVGGGYDACEDANSASPACGSAKGKVVYVIDADTGSVIRSFETLRSVASDVSYIDMDFDQKPDYAYVGDTGGNLYRINFSTYNSSTNHYESLSAANWSITRIAYTGGGGRKFLFAPAVYGGGGKVYVALGSGDREHPLQSHYPYASSISNRFYVYRDCLPNGALTTNTTGGDNLDDTTIMNLSSATNPPTCEADKTLASNCSTNKGWFMNLDNGTGEQTVTSALISGGMVTFSTNRPIPAAAGTCATALGEARGYWLDLYNGSGAIGVAGSCGGAASAAFVGGGLPPSPVTGTILINGKPTSVIIGAVKKTGDASSPISPQKAAATNLPARKRVYSIIKGDN